MSNIYTATHKSATHNGFCYVRGWKLCSNGEIMHNTSSGTYRLWKGNCIPPQELIAEIEKTYKKGQKYLEKNQNHANIGIMYNRATNEFEIDANYLLYKTNPNSPLIFSYSENMLHKNLLKYAKINWAREQIKKLAGEKTNETFRH
jgi:hypothetical protein